MEEMYREEHGIFIPYLDVLTKDDDGITISAFDYSTTYDDAMKELKRLYDSAIQNGSVVEYMEIQEIRGSGKIIRHQQYFSKYKDADLSDLPYEKRKAIRNRFTSITYHIFDADLNKIDEICTLYDESNISRFNISEDIEIFNIGDRVKCKHTNLVGTVISSPGIPYSSVKWEYVYDVKCDNEDYGIKHLNGHVLERIR